MTVRNYLLWGVVAFATTACSLEFKDPSSADAGVDVFSMSRAPVALGKGGRGVQSELPPVPQERHVASLQPPLPAERPWRIGDRTDLRSDDMSLVAQHGRNVPYPEGEAAEIETAARSEPVDEPLFEPKKFFGMSADGVRTLLGPPQMVYQRPPSTVWHYRDGFCELDLYFYLDVASGKFRVATFDLSPHRDNASQHQNIRCLKRLRIAYHAP